MYYGTAKDYSVCTLGSWSSIFFRCLKAATVSCMLCVEWGNNFVQLITASVYLIYTIPNNTFFFEQIRDKLLVGERLSKPKRCHQRMYDLMLLCWTKTPKDRPKFVEVIKHLSEVGDRYYLQCTS